ncbi:MAG: VWA domain-containing protein [Bacteroidota bacterium]
MKILSGLACAFLTIAMIGCGTTNDSMMVSPDGFGDNSNPQLSEKYKDYEENPFVSTTEQPVSTFSIDADGGSYSNMRRYINSGQKPPKASVRIEEYINFFTYNYSEPAAGENVSINSEMATCPWNTQHQLVRIGLKGKTLTESELGSSNFVFLIDVSGSMSSEDRLPLLKQGFKIMADGLKDDDRVAIVTYAGEAGVLLQSTKGSEKAKIKAAIDQLGAGGGTAGAAGIKTAYEIAVQNFIVKGNNRVILGTDGDFNVGTSSTDELVKLIEEKRESGVYLTVLGFGTGNLNDEMMEQIANKGNGNYEYIDNSQQLKKVFIDERERLYTVAKDGKIQITFNPATVESYRLIGYENRSLNKEDFVDDKKDAGEIGSGQTITALYEVVLKDIGDGIDYVNMDFRYKMPNEDVSRLLSHTIKVRPVEISKSSENMRFVTAVTGLGLMMKESQHKGTLTKQMILDLANGARSFDPQGLRAEFIGLVQKMP